uniref:Ubiquitin-like domain-containing protein n=1 Tax=Setaria digitata TaxID=48799 RepID=A0A915Q2T2_9BILA
MASFIEGIGDEVIWFLVAATIIVLISLAWISTGIPPVDYYVWLVQMQIHPNRRIVQVLQVDNQEVNLFRGRPERQSFGAVTEQTLEALMDGRIIEQSNSLQDSALSQTAEIIQEQTDDGNSLRSQEISQVEQTSILTETTENLLYAGYVAAESGSWQPSENPLASTSVENGKNPATDKHKLSAVVAAGCSNAGCGKPKISDSVCQFTEGEGDNAGCQLSNVKLKFLDDSQVIACTALESTVGQFKRRYFWESILAGKIVRLIYRGQLLRDDTRSLLSYGLHDQCVVHCHVSSTPYAQPSSSVSNTSNNTILSGTKIPSDFLESVYGGMNLGNINNGTTAAAIAAIVGSRSASNSQEELIGTNTQTFRARSAEDNQNDPILMRIRNTFLRIFRHTYNVIMGPDPAVTTLGTSLDAAADAASRNGWNQNENAIGSRVGQYVQFIFIGKLDRFCKLESMFFASILFSNAHRVNSNDMQAQAQA